MDALLFNGNVLTMDGAGRASTVGFTKNCAAHIRSRAR